jgi:hypothetical protein
MYKHILIYIRTYYYIGQTVDSLGTVNHILNNNKYIYIYASIYLCIYIYLYAYINIYKQVK